MIPTPTAPDPRRPPPRSPQPVARIQARTRTLPQTQTQTQPQMQMQPQPQPQPQTLPLAQPQTKILPSPPPLQTQSLSQPQIPPFERGRSSSRAQRYPAGLARELDSKGNPRPLLHRRGTSHMYETLEDLLKEAGYKETRIFTPAEHEPPPLPPPQDQHSGVRGAVVRLFSAWMSSAGSSRPAHEDADPDDARVPPSPLAHRSTDASSLRLPSPPRSSHSAAARSLARASLASLARSAATPPPPPQAPARLRTTLRHTASAPHIDKRARPHRPSRSSNVVASPPPPVPPLPTWLQAFSAALCSPPLSASSTGSAFAPSATPSAPRTPPSAWARTSTSLTRTTVLCRSAPSPRTPSLSVRAPLPSLAQCEEWPRVLPARLPLEGEDEDEDEDEPDLDLSTMLIPAKRQHSIRSLRSVLLQHQRSNQSAGLALGPRQRGARGDQYDAGAGPRMRRRGGADENDTEDLWDSGEFLAGVPGAAGGRGRRRRGRMPRSWEWAGA